MVEFVIDWLVEGFKESGLVGTGKHMETSNYTKFMHEIPA